MALQAYIDDSVEHGKVLVLAGYIASAERWQKFSDAWQERLDHARWKRFKMSEIAASGSQDQMEKAGWFYRAIEDHAQAFIAVAVEIEPLKRVVEELQFRPADNPTYLENPYVLAFRSIIDFTAQYQHELGITEPIDFIFDDRGEKKDVRRGYEVFMEWCREDLKNRLGREPMFEGDEDFLPLQAADCWAWHVRKHWLQNGSITKGIIMPSWRPSKNIPGHRLNMDEYEIRKFLGDLKARVENPMAAMIVRKLSVTFSCDLSLPQDEKGE
jgi:hypothetical protein